MEPKFRRVLMEKTATSCIMYEQGLQNMSERILVATSKVLILSRVLREKLLNPHKVPSLSYLYKVHIGSRILIPVHKIPKCILTSSYRYKLGSYSSDNKFRVVLASDVKTEIFSSDINVPEEYINDKGILGYHLLAADSIEPVLEKILNYERSYFGDMEDIIIDVLTDRDIMLAGYLADNNIKMSHHPSSVF